MKKLFTVFLTLFLSAQLVGADIQWSFPPTTLSSANQNASDPQIAMDGSGNLVAVWLEGDVLKASTKQVDQDWTGAVILAKSQATSPSLVSSALGESTVAWVQNGAVTAATKLLTGNWSSPAALSNNKASSPFLAVAPSGNLVAVWTRNGNIESATKIAGRNWASSSPISAAGATAPHVSINGPQNQELAVVVWHTLSGTTTTVYAASSGKKQKNWGTPQIISDSNHDAAFARIAVDTSGNATAIWFAYDIAGSLFSNVNLQSAALPANGQWSPPARLSDFGTRDPSLLQARITCDGNGNTIALWNNSYDGSTFTIQSAVKPIRQNWSNVTTLVNSNPYAYVGDLSVNGLGDALSLYMFYNGAFLLVQSAESDITGFRNNMWSVPLNVSFGANNGFPHVCSALNGNTLNAGAIWISHNGSFTSISATTGQRRATAPPSQLSLVQSTSNFGVLNETSNTLSWVASSDVDVVGYVIFRNGAVLQQVTPDVLQIIDHNQALKGPVTYGVAARNSQNSLSQIITISLP